MADKNLFSTISDFTDKHSPEILLGFGIAGMITASILSAKGASKAKEAIDQKKKEQRADKLSVWDTVKASWKYYIPAILTGGVSTALLIGSNAVQNKRTAALATVYAMTESAFKKYTEKVIETVGEKKELQIREKISKEELENHPVEKNVVIMTGSGQTLCYDLPSKTYFDSDKQKIEAAVNEINRRLRNDMFITVNEFYAELGLPPIELGNFAGWDIDKGYLEPKFDTQLSSDGRPALVLDYDVVPKYRDY